MSNQYTGVDQGEYAGWRNRSTWCLALWCGNDEGYYRWYQTFVTSASHGDTDSVWLRYVKPLYRRVWKEKAKANGCIWKNVDWETLKQHFLEEVEDAKGTSNA